MTQDRRFIYYNRRIRSRATLPPYKSWVSANYNVRILGIKISRARAVANFDVVSRHTMLRRAAYIFLAFVREFGNSLVEHALQENI